MRTRVLAVIAAVVIALLGATMAFVYARNADSRAVAGQEARNVYVSKAVIPAGTSLTDAQNLGLLEQTQVAAKAYPIGALESITSANGKLVALSNISPGVYVLSAAFGKEAVGSASSRITVPPGLVAISLSLSDPAKVGNFVTPGSRIAIFQTYLLKSFKTDAAAKQFNDLNIKGTSVLVPDVQVVGMGDATANPPVQQAAADGTPPTNQQAQSPGAVFLVTVAVRPEDAVRVVHAINVGYTLYAGLLGNSTKVSPDVKIDDSTYLDSKPTS